jgi:putative ABC transport system permease protein
LHNLISDLRFGWRRLRRSPGFAFVAIVSLALGIGANTAIFSLVNAVVLRKSPLERPEELLDVYFSFPGIEYGSFSYPDYVDVRDDMGAAFSSMAAMHLSFVQRDLGDSFEPLAVELITGEYFPLRGLRPALGRLLGPEDDVSPGGHPVVVLSHAYWQSSFAGDPGIIGREVRVNGSPYEVVGVAPAEYEGDLRGLAPQLYLPMMMVDRLQPTTSSELEARGNHSLFVKARLAPGTSQQEVETRLANIATRLRAAYPGEWVAGNKFVVLPTAEVIMNPMIDGVLVAISALLSVVVGLVLLIACANLAGFLLAQAQDRRKEIAIRLALGARRSALIRQLLTETVALALVGGIVGIGLSMALLELLVSIDLPLPFPITLDLAPDARVLGFAFLVSVVAGVLFGLAPALQSTNPDVAQTLKDETAGGAAKQRFPVRDILVAGQVAMSLVLLVGAGLFLRSLQARQDVDPGFGDAPAGIVSFTIPSDRYDRDEARVLMRSALERIAAIPDVSAVGMTSNLHLNLLNTSWRDVNIDGLEPPPGQQAFLIDYATADAGYFEAVGIPIVSGRTFDDAIDVADASPVAIVNQAFAERFWPGENAVGRMFRSDTLQISIVGIARTAKIRSIGEAPRPMLYRPASQAYTSSPTVVARTRGDDDALAIEMSAILRSLDPDLVMFETKTMERHLASLLLPFRLGAVVLMAMSGLALLLAIIGLYGVVSYAVSRRTREVGIRMSLGAEPGSVVRLIMGGGLKLLVAGSIIGIVLSLAGSLAVRGLLYGVQPIDPVAFLLVPAVLAAVTLMAAWLAARRASRIDPVQAMRS